MDGMNPAEQIIRMLIPSGLKACCDAFERVKNMTPEEIARMQADGFNQAAGKPAQMQNNVEDRYFNCYHCSICKNKYMIAEADGTEVKYKQCPCVKIRKSIFSAKKSHMSELVNFRINDYKIESEWQKDPKQKAVDFCLNPAGWFVALGQSGSGKTHLCAGICNKLIKDGKQVQYMSWVQFRSEMERIRFDDAKRGKLFSEYADADVLYIDDFWKELSGSQKKPANLALSFELIDSRYNSKKITLLSSEFTVPQLAQIDEAIAGRIRERAGKNLIQIQKDGKKNYRLYGVNKND